MIVGIDLGGMSAKGALFESGAQKSYKGKSRVALSSEMSVEEVADALAGLYRAVLRAADVSEDEAEAIGIGSPGVIDGEHGVVVQWSNYGWRNVPLAALVRERTKKRVFLVNDANAAALGEAKFGVGQAYDDCALITIGTGVGCGVVLGGKLFVGYRGAGTEFGHTVLRMGGLKCACGRRGCLERYASASALIGSTRYAMRKNPSSRLWEFAHSLPEVDGKTVFAALKAGDETAKRVFSRYIAALGDSVVNLVNLLRPQAVMLGGGISAEGEALLAPLREYVYPRLYVPTEYAPLALVAATLGNDAGLYGAAEYAREQLETA